MIKTKAKLWHELFTVINFSSTFQDCTGCLKPATVAGQKTERTFFNPNALVCPF